MMASPLRWLSVRAVPYILVGLTLLKIIGFVALESAGKIEPFAGANAKEVSLRVAERLVQEGRYNGPDSREDSHYPPGYPFILAVLLFLAPNHYLDITVALQMAIDLLTAYLLFWAGSRFASWQAGFIAGVIWLLLPPEVAISTWITQESMFIAWLTWSALVLTVSLSRPGAGLTFVAGLLLGVATLFRPTAVYFPFFLLPLWFFFAYPRRWQKALYLVLGAACIITPWSIRNWVVLHDRILVSTGYGATFFQSSDERLYTIEGKHKWYSTVHAEVARDGVVKPNTDKDSELDRWLLQCGLSNYRRRWQQRPWSFVPFFTDRFFRLWYANESGAVRSEIGLGLCSILFAPLGIWQLWRWRNTQRDLALIAGALILYFVGVHLIVFPEFRYVLPVFPWLILGWSAAVAAWLLPREATI
jgi:4-amino-4-deoxy-L-arabinose transferase-like glycosyltransferase